MYVHACVCVCVCVLAESCSVERAVVWRERAVYERLPVGAREFSSWHNGIARQPDLGKPPKAMFTLIVPPQGSSIQLELYMSRSKVAMHVTDVLD